MKKITALLSILFLLSTGSVVASKLITTNHIHDESSKISHSGRTDAEGCHNDRKRGAYHCH